MPAATVWCEISSIRMKLPVARMASYASAASGCCTVRLMVAMPFAPLLAWKRGDLLGVGGTANVTYVAGTGLPSTAATAVGSTAITSMSQTFFLNESLGENIMTRDAFEAILGDVEKLTGI